MVDLFIDARFKNSFIIYFGLKIREYMAIRRKVHIVSNS